MFAVVMIDNYAKVFLHEESYGDHYDIELDTSVVNISTEKIVGLFKSKIKAQRLAKKLIEQIKEESLGNYYNGYKNVEVRKLESDF